mgnify:CR=1 FL=1
MKKLYIRRPYGRAVQTQLHLDDRSGVEFIDDFKKVGVKSFNISKDNQILLAKGVEITQSNFGRIFSVEKATS